MRLVLMLFLALLLCAGSVQAQSVLQTKKVITLSVAKKLAAAAETEALKRDATVVIAIVDDGGNLIVLHRLDDTQVASVEVAIGKAKTAVKSLLWWERGERG
jgi:uncharacterized protein GlcG (DUF336 family)